MATKDGGPAFPRDFEPNQAGMTLRDYFAAQALIGMLADSDSSWPNRASLARDAYEIADAMLREREK